MPNNLLSFAEGGRSGNVVQIEDNNYIFNVFLWNGTAKTGITFSSVNELKIVDDLRYFYSYGYMSFNDTNDVLETYNGPNGDGSVTPYSFRGDGRDYLQVEIMPQLKPNDVFIQSPSEEEKRDFCLKYTFSIYKIEEQKILNSVTKSKKIYFWDVDYQLLNEITANFSSSEIPMPSNTNKGGGSISQFSKNNSSTTQKAKNTDDVKRYSGDLIKNLLNKSLNKITTSGFKASKDWDKGGALIEYHTNGKYKAIDDLQYLLQYHVSDAAYDYVPCILKKIRYTDEYSLIPITAYTLNNATSEEFTIGKMDPGNNGSVGNIKKFQAAQSPYSFNATNYNIIENYSFIKPDADMIQKDVSTHFVHSYDPNGFFTCSIKSNNFGNSKKGIFQNNNGAGTTSNALRENNNNAQHVYSAGLGIGQSFQKLNFGRNKGLLASVFKNTAIYFKIRGLTRRRSGTYFSVDRNDTQTPTDNDIDLLGKYFTTLVIHEFVGGKYFNHIYGTKPDGVKHNSNMV